MALRNRFEAFPYTHTKEPVQLTALALKVTQNRYYNMATLDLDVKRIWKIAAVPIIYISKHR